MSDYQPAPDETQLPLFSEMPATVKTSESHRAGRAASRDAKPGLAQLRDDQRLILKIVQAAGDYGATSSEISESLGKAKNCFSGRITELVQAGFLYRREGVRRGRDAVLFARS